MASKIFGGLWVVAVALVSSLVSILLGILYFGVTLWVIKTASDFFFGSGIEANWAVLAAALLSTGAILAGAIERK
jgi:uncharacterized protein (DUF697 family)